MTVLELKKAIEAYLVHGEEDDPVVVYTDFEEFEDEVEVSHGMFDFGLRINV